MKGTIKILVDAHALAAGYQGAGTFITGLYNALHSHHNDTEIFFATTNAASVKQAFPFADDGHIFVLPKRKPAILRMRYDFPALLKKMRFDFAHFQYISPKQVSGCRFIVTTHDVLFNDYPAQFSWLYRTSRNWLFSRSIKKAGIKTTVSAYSRQRISRHYGISENDIALLPNAVAENFGNNFDKAAAKKYVKEKYGIENFILYVSRIEPRKNQLLLLKKYIKLQLWQKNIPLVFVGSKSIVVPGLTKMLQAMDSVQRSHVYFLNNIGAAGLEALYKSCRVFVYPSMAEGFGIPPLEAAVCRAPVLCAAVTAMEDFDFFKPHAFNPADEAGFEQQLARIVASPPDEAFVAGVAAAVRQKYSWDKTAAALYGLLQQRGGCL